MRILFNLYVHTYVHMYIIHVYLHTWFKQIRHLEVTTTISQGFVSIAHRNTVEAITVAKNHVNHKWKVTLKHNTYVHTHTQLRTVFNYDINMFIFKLYILYVHFYVIYHIRFNFHWVKLSQIASFCNFRCI